MSRFLLVCCLLLMQLGGMAHAFSHLQHAHDQDGQPAAERVCATCLAFADSAAALPARALAAKIACKHTVPAVLATPTHTPVQTAAYRSRAPPRTAR